MEVISSAPVNSDRAITRIIGELTYRRRLFEIVLDLILIGVAYYLAVLTYYNFSVNEIILGLFLRSLPLAYAAAYLSFFLTGVYRPVWEYVGVGDLLTYLKATIGSALIPIRCGRRILFIQCTSGDCRCALCRVSIRGFSLQHASHSESWMLFKNSPQFGTCGTGIDLWGRQYRRSCCSVDLDEPRVRLPGNRLPRSRPV